MTHLVTRDHGFEDAKRELYKNGGAWTVNRVRNRLMRKLPASYCRGYLGCFLSRGLITEAESRRILKEVAPLRTTPTLPSKPTRSQPPRSDRTVRNNPSSAVRAKPATPVRGNSVRCRCDVLVVAGVTHCPQCGWLVRPELFEEQRCRNRERWLTIA